jgi:hypothetical protein
MNYIRCLIYIAIFSDPDVRIYQHLPNKIIGNIYIKYT